MTLGAFSCLNGALLRNFNFFDFFFLALKIALKSPFFTAPAPLYQSSKGNHSSSPSNFFHPPLCVQPPKDLFFTIKGLHHYFNWKSSQRLAILLRTLRFRILRRHVRKGQVVLPVGKLRINAPPKNPATIVIREPRAHRESRELVNSSVRQT